MPRLSIVVPFKKNAARLESTLLSILENRPHDSEVILVHDGNYDDPYSLGQDELLVVDSEGSSSLISLVNEGVRAACAPIVHILFPGMEVESGWVDSAIDAFQANEVGAVSLGRAPDWKCEGIEIGLSQQWLPRRSICKGSSREQVSPWIGGGLFRRRVLLALDGFWERGSVETAEAEIGLALNSLEFVTMSDADAVVVWSSSADDSHALTYATGYSAGQLAAAYAKIDTTVTVDSLVSRIGHLASGLMSPGTVAERLGWVLGVRDESWSRGIRNRIEGAEEQLAAWRASQHSSSKSMRRAA